MESEFRTPLITEEHLGSKYARITYPFYYYSATLKQTIKVPVNFVCDYESVPLLKTSSKHAGVIHDYLCRKDSKPLVTKQLAATIYLEAQTIRDELHYSDRNIFFKFFKLLKRQTKTLIVRVAPGYFHKHYVSATLADLTGRPWTN